MTSIQQGNRKYIDIKHLEEPLKTFLLLDNFIHLGVCKLIRKKSSPLPVFIIVNDIFAKFIICHQI